MVTVTDHRVLSEKTRPREREKMERERIERESTRACGARETGWLEREAVTQAKAREGERGERRERASERASVRERKKEIEGECTRVRAREIGWRELEDAADYGPYRPSDLGQIALDKSPGK